MREAGSQERLVMSPRGSVTSRPRSVREVYHPAVQDLSQQAARNGNVYQDESVLSVVSTCTPRSSRPATENNYTETFASPTPLLSQFNGEEFIKTSPIMQMCFNQHNNEYIEDLHRQRVLVSANNRRKLHRSKSAKSTPLCNSRNCSESDLQQTVNAKHRDSWQCSEEENEKLKLVVTNSTKLEEKDFQERVNYRLTLRTKPKSMHGNLMPNGPPLPLLNGYNQTLVQSYPKYSQQYTNWLTNGLKIQSFRGNQSKFINEYSHAKPPPPLVQYLNRPKTHNGRWNSRRGNGNVEFNIIGVQKEVQNPDSVYQQVCKANQKHLQNGQSSVNISPEFTGSHARIVNGHGHGMPSE